MYEVTYIVKTGFVKITKHFDSYFLCRNFVNKCKNSKKVMLVSYPHFD